MNFNNLYVHWTIISNSSLASVHIDINLGTFCKIITLLDKDIWRDPSRYISNKYSTVIGSGHLNDF